MLVSPLSGSFDDQETMLIVISVLCRSRLVFLVGSEEQTEWNCCECQMGALYTVVGVISVLCTFTFRQSEDFGVC